VARPYRFALLGCGFQGRYHAANIATHSRASLEVCCDLDRARARSLSDEYGAGWHTDYRAVLEDIGTDAVVIATTTNTHHEMALAAAAAGKHILLEKPMAVNVMECLAIDEAVRRAGVCLMVGYKFRFMESVRRAKQAVGTPLILTAHTLYDLTQEISSWVNDRALSGGRLMSSLVHAVDLLRFLAGAEVTAVTAAGGNLAIEGLNDIDGVVATLEFSNGAVASLVHGTAGESALVSVWSFQTAGRGVNATIYAHGRRALIHRAGSPDEPAEYVDPTPDPFAAGTAELLDAFIHAIDLGEVGSADAHDGVMAVVVSRAIEKAVHTGSRQTIEPPLAPA